MNECKPTSYHTTNADEYTKYKMKYNIKDSWKAIKSESPSKLALCHYYKKTMRYTKVKEQKDRLTDRQKTDKRCWTQSVG